MFKYSVPYYTTQPFDAGWNPAPENTPDKNNIWYRQLDAFRDFKRFNGEDTDKMDMDEANKAKRIQQGLALSKILDCLKTKKLLSLGSGKRFHEKTIAEHLPATDVIASDIYYREEEQASENLFLYPLDLSDQDAVKKALKKWEPDSLLSYTSVSVITDSELKNLVELAAQSKVKYFILYTAEEMRLLNLITYTAKLILWKATGRKYVNGGYFRSYGQIKNIFKESDYILTLNKIISQSPSWLDHLKGCQRLMIFSLASVSSSKPSKNILNKVDISVFEHSQ